MGLRARRDRALSARGRDPSLNSGGYLFTRKKREIMSPTEESVLGPWLTVRVPAVTLVARVAQPAPGVPMSGTASQLTPLWAFALWSLAVERSVVKERQPGERTMMTSS